MTLKKESDKSTVKTVEQNFNDKFFNLDNKLKSAFNTIKEEFEDHLDAINQNTDEIQTYFDHLCEVEAKIDKLGERLDQIQMAIGQQTFSKEINLNYEEQRLFILLYTHEQGFMSFDELVSRAKFSSEQARTIVSSMLDKGVQLVREISEGSLFLKLNPSFKARQVRENIVKIEPSVVRQMENKVLGSFF